MSLLTLPADDIVHTHLFKLLSVTDILNIRLAENQYVPLVDSYLAKLRFIDWDRLAEKSLKVLSRTTSNLREVDISQNYNFKDNHVRSLLKRNKEIQILVMRRCPQLSAYGVHPLLDLKQLTTLNLRKNRWVTNSFLHLMTMNLHAELLCIDLSACPVSDSSLVPFFKKFSKLKSVDLENIQLMSDRTLYAISANCPEITFLNLIWNKKIGDNGLRLVVESCPHLKTLLLLGCDGISRKVKATVIHLAYH